MFESFHNFISGIIPNNDKNPKKGGKEKPIHTPEKSDNLNR